MDGFGWLWADMAVLDVGPATWLFVIRIRIGGATPLVCQYSVGAYITKNSMAHPVHVHPDLCSTFRAPCLTCTGRVARERRTLVSDSDRVPSNSKYFPRGEGAIDEKISSPLRRPLGRRRFFFLPTHTPRDSGLTLRSS